MKTLIPILAALLLVSCQKENSKTMAETLQNLPLKAVANYTVDGLKITLLADKSEGDVCAYGWQANINGDSGPFTFAPNSSEQGTKNADGTYISGSCKIIPIVCTVPKAGIYSFDLEVLDSKKNSNWATNLKVEVK